TPLRRRDYRRQHEAALRQQQTIHLYYIEERKYDDICLIMGINYQSVRNLMHRSMSRLKEMAANNKEIN
ncbi:sigma factor-like helix-turn-helix DNA-binding protein, partial [uncultured Prevotella sp.]|uniref:sigma factor-like helix-turn-helix DNA-binding protein n=1 Tax=uncultured Prevotella sp. TaxID=159272 RepID=UPI00261AA459